MKSSAISLLTPRNIYPNKDTEHSLINLIDSPGHIDFGFEVVSALKLCDGAILIIDVVEGVSSQTIQLMKQAVSNNLKIILFLNKLDKLISLLDMNMEDVYYKLSYIVETANASMNVLLGQL